MGDRSSVLFVWTLLTWQDQTVAKVHQALTTVPQRWNTEDQTRVDKLTT